MDIIKRFAYHKGETKDFLKSISYGDTRDKYYVTHLSIRQLNKEYNRYK